MRETTWGMPMFRYIILLWVVVGTFIISSCLPDAQGSGTLGATSTLCSLTQPTATIISSNTPSTYPPTTTKTATPTPSATAKPLNVGDAAWTFETTKTSRLLVEGQLLLCGSGEPIYALDVQSGQLYWDKDLEEPFYQAVDPVASSSEAIFVLARENLHALRKIDGTLLWSVKSRRYTEHRGPIVLENQVVLVSDEQYLLAYDAHTGSRLWYYDAERVIFHIAAGEGAIFMSTDTMVGKLDAQTRTLLWHIPGRSFHHIALSKDIVYVSATEQDGSGRVYALDIQDGHMLGEFRTTSVFGTPYTVPYVVDHELYVWVVGQTNESLQSSYCIFYALKTPELEQKWYYKIEQGNGFSVVGETVYFTTIFGSVYAVDRRTGHEFWSLDLKHIEPSPRSSPPPVVAGKLIIYASYSSSTSSDLVHAIRIAD